MSARWPALFLIVSVLAMAEV